MLSASFAADDLLAALSSPSSRASLRSRFCPQPFCPHLPVANPAQAVVEEGDQAPDAPSPAFGLFRSCRGSRHAGLRFICVASTCWPVSFTDVNGAKTSEKMVDGNRV
ncbi:hypothetical protein ZWY2020_017829 [Hordeum vulgare]|nr:hypothetical protein ZWY2020_017829 [Hordeum vulgare]